jgi:hypothetical protein
MMIAGSISTGGFVFLGCIGNAAACDDPQTDRAWRSMNNLALIAR